MTKEKLLAIAEAAVMMDLPHLRGLGKVIQETDTGGIVEFPQYAPFGKRSTFVTIELDEVVSIVSQG